MNFFNIQTRKQIEEIISCQNQEKYNFDDNMIEDLKNDVFLDEIYLSIPNQENLEKFEEELLVCFFLKNVLIFNFL